MLRPLSLRLLPLLSKRMMEGVRTLLLVDTSAILILQQPLRVHHLHLTVLRHNPLKVGYMPTVAHHPQLLPLHLHLCSSHHRTSQLLLLPYKHNILPLLLSITIFRVETIAVHLHLPKARLLSLAQDLLQKVQLHHLINRISIKDSEYRDLLHFLYVVA